MHNLVDNCLLGVDFEMENQTRTFSLCNLIKKLSNGEKANWFAKFHY